MKHAYAPTRFSEVMAQRQSSQSNAQKKTKAHTSNNWSGLMRDVQEIYRTITGDDIVSDKVRPHPTTRERLKHVRRYCTCIFLTLAAKSVQTSVPDATHSFHEDLQLRVSIFRVLTLFDKRMYFDYGDNSKKALCLSVL
eukprot:1195752-Prorocentrum_minimum.AAC.4